MIHGPLSFRSLHSISSSDWALFGCGLSPSYLACVPFFLVFVGWLVLLPCHCPALAIISLILLPCCYLWAYGPKFLPVHFLHSFLLLGFASQHSYWASPFYALGFLSPFHSVGIFAPFHSFGILDPFDSFLPLPLPWVFAKSFGFPRPNCHIFTFRAYWPLCQPYEFTNSFLGLSRPILLSLHLLHLPWVYYFIPWASSAHLLSSLALIIFMGLLTIIPTILA